MKKSIITLLALLAVMTASAQQPDTLRFMNSYRQFVSYATTKPLLTKHVADSLIARQDSLRRQYRKVKPLLTNTQVEEYNRLKGRYTKKMLEYRSNRVGDGLSATGDSIANTAGRVGSAVGGFFKGLFNK
ncbi:MAG: hypothetical protein K6D91_07165 [Prevotella sp.]|nr:hypothetical protein [Prevotella sp.]